MHKNKALVSLVFGLGIILVGGIGLLGYGLYQRGSDPDFKFFKTSAGNIAVEAPSSAPPAAITANLPSHISIPLSAGAKVKEIETTNGKIIVHVTHETKRDQIMVLDADNGTILRQFRFDPKK